uniref:Secreted protein n=1 Tax=Pyxicephalus adspersus TaxID=30357 RepID=A0AAV3AK96_PYXAD|nr:TPA: hypothetical protein GDO54_009841 [Pyxicephalus adspersus]
MLRSIHCLCSLLIEFILHLHCISAFIFCKMYQQWSLCRCPTTKSQPELSNQISLYSLLCIGSYGMLDLCSKTTASTQRAGSTR